MKTLTYILLKEIQKKLDVNNEITNFSIQNISQELHISCQTLRRCIKEGEKLGFLTYYPKKDNSLIKSTLKSSEKIENYILQHKTIKNAVKNIISSVNKKP